MVPWRIWPASQPEQYTLTDWCHIATVAICCRAIFSVLWQSPSSGETAGLLFAESWSVVHKRHLILLDHVILDTQHSDSCICACSVNGCLPLTAFFAGWSIWGDPRYPLMLAHIVARIFDAEAGARPPSQSLCDTVAPVVIRCCTFTGLGIRHTCRYHEPECPDWGRVDLEDIAEVQEEDRLLIARLEELVSEFESKYLELELPLAEFLRGYWTSRMEEELAEGFNEGEVRVMREVGVVVEVP
ncbi:uncharacterized protein DSM5745_01559 [Aspergillus mulundensis]|uniref:Uncharacterized protein n=1 Tax=Aspergillus mulundensis TaxID=1810919 RepID=A0A3D8T6Q4_9EURO|nr:hypothetical protein DSM5745_01559 [Aspergillus mulundensis]RDW94237.1 hypothetical protein DSM5745_01559 [Aspergillus mulundensis]